MSMLIAGRALQGCGAVAGVALAFAADHTRAKNRSVVMALIGMGIGMSFLLSMMISVPLATVLGLSGLFWLTSALGVMGVVLVFSLPRGGKITEDNLQEPGENGSIWPLIISVFLLHAVMTLLFVVLPGMLVSHLGFSLAHHWQVYVPAMLGSVVLAFPLLRRLAAGKHEGRAIPLAFLLLGGTLGLLSLSGSIAAVIGLSLGFFLAFNLLEATMPSLVSRLVGSAGRGQQMGLYTTFQFLGAFAGGVSGGWLLGFSGEVVTLSVAGAVCALWAVVMKIWLQPSENRKRT